ncbi:MULTISPECIES: SAM-dependent methyltransferase [Streptomyces]|uniref:SAM-dependent methyltransferase n=1 Tax=Streptomyces TaxID=1883 RepID=UPI00223E5D03|nr:MULTISPECIES: SAM-dependent methyltransferase [Streptomyces]
MHITVDVSKPSVARMYDWLLGGKDNFHSDREACDELLRLAPSTRELAVINRLYLKRVVHWLATNGIRQFLDHGSGLPTQDNVHQVAQRVDEDCSVVYVDIDPVVLAHGRAALDENDRTAVIQADFRDTEGIFAHPDTQRLIDLDEPVAALFVSVLHCIPDSDDPWGLVRRVAERLPSGSYLVICQLASDDEKTRESVTEFMRETTGGTWGRVRSFAEVDSYFDGLELVDPPVDVSLWRPDSDLSPRQATQEWVEYGSLARKP